MDTGLICIGEYAFRGCSIENITIPETVTNIGDGAFWNSTTLVSVVIGNGVIAIGDVAFYCCPYLSSLTLGSSLVSIGNNAFAHCDQLAEVINLSSLEIAAGATDYGKIASNAIEVHKGVSKIDTLGEYRFYAYNGVNYLIGYGGNDLHLVLPESYKGSSYIVRKYALAYLEITSVYIPSNVTSLEQYAFYDCQRITDVYYSGDSEEWARINIENAGNYYFTSATIHYNYTPEE